MGRKLSQLNWEQLKKELSIAGNPDEMIEIAKDIEALYLPRINVRNLAELENMLLVLDKVKADLKLWERSERNRQHPKRKKS